MDIEVGVKGMRIVECEVCSAAIGSGLMGYVGNSVCS